AVRDLFGARVFGEGTLLGAVAFGLVLLSGWRTERRRVDWAGVGFAAAAYVTLLGVGPLHGTGGVPNGLLGGVPSLAAGCLAIRLFRRPRATAVLCYAPGAYVVAYHTGLGLRHEPTWVRPTVFGAIALGGLLVLDFDVARERRSLGPL